MYFINRKDAGQKLASILTSHWDKSDSIILALPRGGVPVAYEIAKALRLPMDLMLVRKLGVPRDEEIAMGAIAYDSPPVYNAEIIKALSIPHSLLADTVSKERKEIHRRNKLYRHNAPPPDLTGRNVILIDDGCATGANMHAAILAAKSLGAKQVIAAVPVTSYSAYTNLHRDADKIISLEVPEPFTGVSAYYADFTQVTDKEVVELLNALSRENIYAQPERA